jgi:Rps23 Pro-64 3,4-dihydroxylase Tpa1-like proline 4-hydroxylase
MEEIFDIQSFLDRGLAEEAAAFLTDGMPRDWWYASAVPATAGHGKDDIRNFPDAKERIVAARQRAEDAMIRRQFAYFFYRTRDHVAACRCPACRVIEYLRSPEARARIGTAAGLNGLEAGEFFCSRYVSGCFLGPHTDESNGRLAVILSLSSSWAPEYGGLLHLMGHEGSGVAAVVTPQFNSLACFAVPAEGGRWHFVSHVAPGVPYPRLAIGGWYR